MSQVRDIYEAVKHRLPDRENLYPALNTAVRLVSKRLFYHKSSLVRGSLSVSVTADTSSAALPSDFWGLLEQPNISGYHYPLKPVPSQDARLTYSTNSIPIYYEIVGATIYLYPGSSSAITINGPYWTKPTKITAVTDTIPFNELFDDAIIEGLLHIYQTGLTTGNPNEVSMLREYLNNAVDEVAPYRDIVAPTRVPDVVGYNYMLNDGEY